MAASGIVGGDYVRMMAAYMRWQNDCVFKAADGLSDAERRLDRGAFFASIHGTLAHILWGDRIWMHRLAGFDAPEQTSISTSIKEAGDWQSLLDARFDLDRRIGDFAKSMTDEDLVGEFAWHSSATGRDESVPRAVAWMHLFNHQTHHRGQVHAMLTAAGAKTEDTDLVFMPAGG